MHRETPLPSLFFNKVAGLIVHDLEPKELGIWLRRVDKT